MYLTYNRDLYKTSLCFEQIEDENNKSQISRFYTLTFHITVVRINQLHLSLLMYEFM